MNSVAYLGKNNFSKHGATLAHANGGHMERIAYFGIDVHKDTNTMFMFAQTDDGIIEYDVGTIAAGSEFAIKAIKKQSKTLNLQDMKCRQDMKQVLQVMDYVRLFREPDTNVM